MRVDTVGYEVASQHRTAADSPSWPWSTVWDSGMLCAFSRRVLFLSFSLSLSFTCSPFLFCGAPPISNYKHSNCSVHFLQESSHCQLPDLDYSHVKKEPL